MTPDAPNPALHIIATLGSPRIEEACGVGEHAVRFAKQAKKLPGRWFGALAPLCLAEGIPCPLTAFSWAGPKDGGGGEHDIDVGAAGPRRKMATG